MAYGDNRTTVETDAFPSSIDSGWQNGPDLWSNLLWVTGGFVEALSTSGCIVRVGTAHAADQYATTEVNAFKNNTSVQGVTLRGTSSTTACYLCIVEARSGETPTSAYVIHDVAEAGSSTEVSSDLSFADDLSSGDTITGEAEGTTIRLGTNEGAGDTERTSGTNSSHSSGEPGLFAGDDTDDTRSRSTAWEGGDITAAAGGATLQGSLMMMGVGI